MSVVADVIFTVAVVAVTAGAVAEFQFWVRNISPAADGASVGIGRCMIGRLRRALPEGNRIGLTPIPVWPLLQKGKKIQNILAGKQQIIQHSDQGEQIVGEQVEWEC